jgi:hypothetical protein
MPCGQSAQPSPVCHSAAFGEIFATADDETMAVANSAARKQPD